MRRPLETYPSRFVEKLCLDRLVEEADLAAAQDLFGATIDLDASQPKSAKEFEDFGSALVQKYLIPHSKSAHYKTLVKAVAKFALKPLDVQQTKDIETAVAGIRAEKLKEKTAADAAKKGELLHVHVRTCLSSTAVMLVLCGIHLLCMQPKN